MSGPYKQPHLPLHLAVWPFLDENDCQLKDQPSPYLQLPSFVWWFSNSEAAFSHTEKFNLRKREKEKKSQSESN